MVIRSAKRRRAHTRSRRCHVVQKRQGLGLTGSDAGSSSPGVIASVLWCGDLDSSIVLIAIILAQNNSSAQ